MNGACQKSHLLKKEVYADEFYIKTQIFWKIPATGGTNKNMSRWKSWLLVKFWSLWNKFIGGWVNANIVACFTLLSSWNFPFEFKVYSRKYRKIRYVSWNVDYMTSASHVWNRLMKFKSNSQIKGSKYDSI